MAPLLEDKDGVRINIYSREHLPPHIHVSAGDDEALVNIRTGEIFEGYIPGKKLRIAQAWLNEGTNKAIVEENFYELNPRLRPQKADKKAVIKKANSKKKGGK